MLALKVRDKFGPELGVLAGLGLGAGLMFLCDPERGHRRRVQLRDQVIRVRHHAERAVDRSLRDLANRLYGLVSETMATLLPERIPDEVLADRVRSRLGRLVAHPSAIDVTVVEGRVILRGDVLENEAQRLMFALRLMSGVREVIDNLQVHSEAGKVPSLQGKAHVSGDSFELLRPRWAPATRAVVGAGGLGLLLAGLRRQGLLGGLLGALGTGMVVRSLTNIGPLAGLGLDPQAPGIELQKTATVNAPVGTVFELLKDPAKLPRVLDHVQEVRKVDDTHYHWTVLGPGGAPLSWDSEITQLVPNQLLAWRSSPDAPIRNDGVVQFAPAANGGTRVHIRMRYTPPGGLLGHALAELLDSDPKHVLDRDLVRFKSLLERGKTTVHHHKINIQDLED